MSSQTRQTAKEKINRFERMQDRIRKQLQRLEANLKVAEERAIYNRTKIRRGP